LFLVNVPFQRVEENPAAVARWKGTTHLVVDEISMISAKLFSALDFIGRCVRGIDKPFGGIVLLLFGDFAQVHCFLAVWFLTKKQSNQSCLLLLASFVSKQKRGKRPSSTMLC
jgi:hypothetical protein